MMRITVPGNLLLFGEYAVTEEGGYGIAAAIGPRLTVSVEPASELEITGLWADERVHWNVREILSYRDAGDSGELVPSVVRHVADELSEYGAHLADTSGHIIIDSSSFFSPEGRKRGYGSSAAVAAGLTVVLFSLASTGTRTTPRHLYLTALGAHRAAQGGRGSGYDVAASLFGGMGFFTGGAQPSWFELLPQWLPDFILYPGPNEVKTALSVTGYRRWAEEDPNRRADFLAASNGAVEEFAFAVDWREAVSAGSRAKRLCVELGDRIGVPARLDLPSALSTLVMESAGHIPQGHPEILYKAVGAGDELGVLMTPPSWALAEVVDSSEGGAFVAAHIENEGVVWDS